MLVNDSYTIDKNLPIPEDAIPVVKKPKRKADLKPIIELERGEPMIKAPSKYDNLKLIYDKESGKMIWVEK